MSMTPEQLMATKPTRDQFETDEEFDEAVTRWMSRQGRSPMLRRRMASCSESPTAESSENPAPSSTGRETKNPKLKHLTEAPADHPIYKRGFVIGVWRSIRL